MAPVTVVHGNQALHLATPGWWSIQVLHSLYSSLKLSSTVSGTRVNLRSVY